MDIDKAYERFTILKNEWQTAPSSVETEQDTRFQVIDRMLVEVLGWERTEVKTEPHTDSGYIDYLLCSSGRGRLVVEAKKAATSLHDTKSERMAAYKLSGPALRSAQDGIKQATKYCASIGVGYAALTNGLEWIAFQAVRTDGHAPSEGRALVFPTLDAVDKDFATFVDLFSRGGVTAGLHLTRINEAEGIEIQDTERLLAILPESEIRLLQKSPLALDLERFFGEFFGAMSGDNDPEMLARCFVETKESREADVSLHKIAESLINTIQVVSSERGDDLEQHIRDAVETKKGEFVLIIGNKGAGKTTFVDRFFRLVLDPHLRDRCLVIRINMADSTGDVDSLVDWMTDRLKTEIESALFKESVPTYDELLGVFFREYERWAKGEHKYLYESNKEHFKIKFGEHIDSLVTNQPDKYVRRLLYNAIRARALMPCLVFDNTDHFPQAFQEKVFQYAQSLFREVLSFVICPVTDKTIWQLSKSGPFQSYPATAFYLPVPSTKEVLAKRVQFIKEKISEENEKKGQYFLKKGIRLTIANIQAFAASIEEIFINTDYFGRIIGWLANHDIRRSLEVTRRIVTSPFLSVENLVSTYIAENRITIPERKLMQALFFGDYNSFLQSHSDFILDVFSIRSDRIHSPLTKVSVLVLLSTKDAQAKESSEAYMSVDDIMSYLEPMGIPRPIVRVYLGELLAYRLVEPYDPTENDVYEEQRLKVTSSGKIHLEFATQNETYITHMALTTPMRHESVVHRGREIFRPGTLLAREDWLRLIDVFMMYCLDQDSHFVTVPRHPAYDGQSRIRTELKNRWCKPVEPQDPSQSARRSKKASGTMRSPWGRRRIR